MTVSQSTDLRIRPARPGDVPEIVDLVQAAYRGEGGWTTEAHLVRGARTHADEVRGMLADDAVALLAAEAVTELERPSDSPEGGIVGCCYTRQEPPDVNGLVQAELGLFAVHPSAQSRGLGGRLLESQAELLTAAGVDVLMIRVLQSRPELHAWYERHGFVRTGTAVPFPGDPSWLTVEGLGMDVMERPLRRV
ncbi:GNAT family N-acetyltransferase [Brachybacterium fresconis]|uniref:GNAT superfamily N-acetyltransferase n=1 Tax=Brachybacterium fresconis TaxID=173363 RepID=A0ABS4YP05_9MICO|nr:GNAT family N-acetyltransferase [Brachybacterium fresconis]MBP2410494.1 GNAT superfamily N-acetyltransferase [Brachybacterium fresconis]